MQRPVEDIQGFPSLIRCELEAGEKGTCCPTTTDAALRSPEHPRNLRQHVGGLTRSNKAMGQTTVHIEQCDVRDDDVIEGPVVGVQTLSAYLGITKQVIYEHARAGRLKKVGPNKFDLQESVRLYCEHLRALAARYKSANGTGITNTMTARARKETAQAQYWELKAQRMRGELIAVDEVRDEWFGIAKRVRGTFLALHSTLILRAGLSKAQATIIRETIREALTELADNETGGQSADDGPR